MKLALGLVLSTLFSIAPAFAGDGNIARRDLARMGLSGMKAMSDAQGMAIRGQAFAFVESFAIVPGRSPNFQINASNGSPISVTSFRSNGVSFAFSSASASAH